MTIGWQIPMMRKTLIPTSMPLKFITFNFLMQR